MNKKTLSFALTIIMFLLCPAKLTAQDNDNSRWYVGMQGGTRMAVSSASSFGGDKTRCGWSAGIFAGRQFNNIFGIEIETNMGKALMSPRSCCADRDNWLGLDGNHYLTAILDTPTLHYHDIMSKVALFDFGLYLNVDLLPLLVSSPSRWNVTISPGITALSSKATICQIDNDSKFISRPADWHVGLACRLHVDYAVNPALSLGLYTSLSYITGDGIDGLPRFYHTSNNIWDSGLRITYNLKKGGRR